MPITDLQRPPSFPLIGRLRKGAPKGDRRPGADLQHFRFESEGNTDPGLVAKFESIYGTTPRAIRVFMPYPTLDQNFSAWREHRSGTKLHHTCDGYHEWKRIGGKLTKTDSPCPTIDLDDRVIVKGNMAKNPDKCQPVGRLSMIVRGLGRFGYVMLSTTSVIDIARLTAELGAIELMAGHLNDIPMVLHRVPEKIPTQMGENRGLVTKYMLHIEIDAEWAALRLESMGESALIDAMAPRGALAVPTAQALPAPRTIDHTPAPIAHNGYAVNPASGEIMAEPDDDDDDATEYEIDPEPAPAPPPTRPARPVKPAPAPASKDSGFVPLLTPAEIKDAWRGLEKAGVEIPTKFWSLALESFPEERTREAMAWIAARQAELDNA